MLPPLAACSPSLLFLPDELLLLVLSALDIPDLLSVSRVSHRLRHLAHDRVLHKERLHSASQLLGHYLPSRPPLSSLQPPSSRIILPQTYVVALRLSRSLATIQLSRKLRRRPSASHLVIKGILPSECCHKDRASGEILWAAGPVAPGIVEVKRKVEKERVKDLLRAALDSMARKVDVLGKRAERAEDSMVGVRRLVRKFAGSNGDDASGSEPAPKKGHEYKWGQAAKKPKRDEPTRAHVLGLRRFWEGISRKEQHAV